MTSGGPEQPSVAWSGKGVLCGFAAGTAEPCFGLLLPTPEMAALQQRRKKPRAGELPGQTKADMESFLATRQTVLLTQREQDLSQGL